jgi:cell division septation protein DedD
VALVAAPAAAQQGSLQVTAAAQSVQGDPRRTIGQTPLEPDVGVSWLQPGTRFGLLQLELRGTRRGDRPHLGKAFFSVRDLKLRGATWSMDAGDAYFTPSIGQYRFGNLSTPSLTFAGASIAAGTARTSTNVLIGRATAATNLFGTDPDTVDQAVALVRMSYAASERVDVFTRASHVRTGRLDAAYDNQIAASDQAGSAIRWIATPALHLVADGGIVAYRHRESPTHTIDGSGLVGASVLLARGWIQVNAARFSPGELPVLNQPLRDRQTLFAAGELDAAARLRVFGGWEAFRSNLDPRPALPLALSASDGSRAFAGLRTPLGSRSSAALRIETGDRRSRPVDDTTIALSDTGVVTAEWQTNAGAVSAVARYSRRRNVESRSGSASYTMDDTSGHLFLTLGPGNQLFGSANVTRTAARDGSGATFWQIGGGGQTGIARRSLWLRGEGTVSRNVDVLSALVIPQQSLNLGLNGAIRRDVILGLNVNADRLVAPNESGASWVSRSMVRITKSFATGPSRAPTSIASLARHGGTGSIAGVVFSDWNANGTRDPGEALLASIPVLLSELGVSTTSTAGEFTFINVPVGLHQVGIDLSALPVDFDPPAVPHLQLQLDRGETKRLAFGLVPLNAIGGTVLLDANGNGIADPGEKPMDGAVIVLDGGARSERVRKGRFRFEAVRAGNHTIELLRDSLPEGAVPSGRPDAPVALTQSHPAAEVHFLVTMRPRPETRRVFPPSPASTGASATRRPPTPAAVKARPAARATPPSRTAEATATASEGFAVQIIALNDPSRARELTAALKAAGLPAYLVEPPATDRNAPYRVRLGRYSTRGEAQAAAAALEKARGEKYWVIRER